MAPRDDEISTSTARSSSLLEPNPDLMISNTTMSPIKTTQQGLVDATAGNHESSGSSPELHRALTLRQLLLMALGGSIGAGLFVGSGQGLSAGGPASLFLNFLIIGCMVCCVMAALGEMATSYPVAGAFYDYAVRFIGPGWGFAMGWTFVLNWLVVLPFELTTIVAQVGFWAPQLIDDSPWLKVGIVLGLLLGLGVVAWQGARAFGELEHFLGICKAAAISAFLVFAAVAVSQGIPGDPRGALGARYWRPDLKPFVNGAQGFFMVFRIAGMAYGGTEMLGLTAAECHRPHRAMPLATKVVFFRIIVFYGIALLMLGLTVPANSKDLGQTGHGASYSPFVLAANMAGVPALGHFFNAMIIAALLAMANTSIFSSSRALQALCAKGMGPAVFAKLDARRGTPLNAVYLAFFLGLLALVTLAKNGGVLFDWLLSLSGVSNYFTWGSICISHLRMRAAMGAQGRLPSQEHLIWRSPFGVWGSWIAVVVCAAGIIAQVVTVAWPVGKYDWQASLRDLLGIFFTLGTFAAYQLVRAVRRRRQRVLVPLLEIDLATGHRSRAFALAADEAAAAAKHAELASLGYCDDWDWRQKAAFHVRRHVAGVFSRRGGTHSAAKDGSSSRTSSTATQPPPPVSVMSERDDLAIGVAVPTPVGGLERKFA